AHQTGLFLVVIAFLSSVRRLTGRTIHLGKDPIGLVDWNGPGGLVDRRNFAYQGLLSSICNKSCELTHMELGRISAIYRYPVKSMAGESLEVARLGWHGIEGDRRLAFRRMTDKSEFPWLSASKLPQLLLYKPFALDSNANSKNGERLPTHVRTPEGKEYELRSDELRKEVSSRCGDDLELMHLKHGMFDEAPISVISLATVRGIARESGRGEGLCDLRRFRPNIVIETN